MWEIPADVKKVLHEHVSYLAGTVGSCLVVRVRLS